MLGKRLGAHGGSRSVNQMLADMDAPTEHDGRDDSALDSAAADNELVKFVNDVCINVQKPKASDIQTKPMPSKAKTGMCFRIDGTLQPYIEVPAQCRQGMGTRRKILCNLDTSEKRCTAAK